MKVQNKKQLDQLSNQGNPFYKVQAGETVIRLMSDIHAVREHGLENIGDQKYKAIACPTENHRMQLAAGVTQDNEVPPCPLCELGYPVTTSYVAAIVEREREEFDKKNGNKIMVGGDAWILKKGPSLMGELQNLLDDESWGATGDYDIKITATGEGFGRKYSVVPVTKDKSPEIKESEKHSLDALYEKIDLEQMTTPRPYDELKKFVEENLLDVYVPKKK